MQSSESTREQIGVLVVDDSAFMRTALTRIIDSESNLRVLGTASSGDEALEKIPDLRPDVITLDVLMPGLDGLQTLRSIMARHPRPVVMVSCGTTAEAEITFRALAAGAFDYIPKQLSATSLEIFHLRDDLVAKIKAAAASARGTANGDPKPAQQAGDSGLKAPAIAPVVVAIGVSTGGPGLCRRFCRSCRAVFPCRSSSCSTCNAASRERLPRG